MHAVIDHPFSPIAGPGSRTLILGTMASPKSRENGFYYGHPQNRLPANANFSFRYIEGESLLFSLDLAGIAVSSGSACSSGSLEPSHVLLAMGLPEGLAHGSIRFSFGKDNTPAQIDYAVDKLKEIVVKLRALSPLFPKDLKNEVFEKEI